MDLERFATPNEQLSYLQGLVSTLGGVIWEFDWSTGAFTYVSKAAEKLLGYSVAEWMEPGFWANHLYPDDAEEAAAYCIASTKALKDHEFEYRMVHRDGSIVWVRDIVTVDAEKGLDGLLHGILIDITAAKRAGEQLERKSQEFDAVFRVMQDLYFRMDANNVVVDFKAPARDLLYSDPTEILGSNILALMPRSMHDMLEANLDLARETDTMVVTQYELYLGGRRTHWEARFLPMGHGHVVVISRDVSDRHEANMRLAQSQERYRALIEMSPYAIYVVGPDHRVVFCNDATETIFGSHPGQTLVGATVGDFMPPGHESTAIMREFQRVVDEVSRCGPGDPMPTTKTQRGVVRTADQRPATIEYTASGIRFRGEPAVMVLARDITGELQTEEALKTSEARLRDTQHRARIGNYAFYVTEGYWESSEGLDAVLGITPEYPREIESWIELVHPEEREAMLSYITEEVLGQGRLFDRDYRVVRPSDGEVRWVHGAGDPVVQSDDGTLVLIGHIQDITQRKLAEESARRYSERLSAMASELTVTEDRERRRLAEELHDRVGQQLAVAKMHLGAAASDPHCANLDELTGAVGLIDEAIDQTRAITTQLAPAVLYELGLMSALRWQCDDVAGSYGLNVHCSGADFDESGVSVEAKMVLFRAVRELLVNVVKHGKTSDAWVSVDELPGWVELNVVDEGCGFDPAGQASGSGESGFGLFSIRERLPHLGGEFELKSSLGRGTHVTLRVPRVGE